MAKVSLTNDPVRTPSRRRTGRGSGGPSRGLDAGDLRSLQVVVDRLSDEFARAISRLGGHVEGSRALARAIGSDVALCHRVQMGLRARSTLSERIGAWPGAAGVQRVAEGLCRALGMRELSGPIALAVHAYGEAIRELAGTHARLVRLVRAAESHSDSAERGAGNDQTPARRQIVRGATELQGYSAEVSALVGVVRPIPGRPELIEGCSAWGLIGLECQTRGAFITSQNIQMRQVAGDLATEVRWTPLGEKLNERDGLLSEFSSQPVPLTATDGADGIIRQMVDASLAQKLGKVDIVLARHWSPDANPQYTPTPSWSQIFRMRHPVRGMLLDFFIHRSMLAATPPTIAAYHWHPGLSSDPRRHWHDRLPGNPRIEVLAQLPIPTPSQAWSRQHELTARLFTLTGWPGEEFIGYRCFEAYPTWGAAYYMTVDLAPR